MNLQAFIDRHRLPDAYAVSAESCFLPFAEWLEGRLADSNGSSHVLGINGAQGTGKSTVAALISGYLETVYKRRVAILSIDDLYLTRSERETLADEVHPMLAIRGVPGTHDVELGLSVINRLCAQQDGEKVAVPRFDKSVDDRCPPEDWGIVSGTVDLVILEGWCVGSRACDAHELELPVNALEAQRDADGHWRQWVNRKLASEYVELFAKLDSLLFLKAPDFESVYEWRLEQEHKLRDSSPGQASGVMTDEQVLEFYAETTAAKISFPTLRDNLVTLVSGKSVEELRSMGTRLAQYARDIVAFLTFFGAQAPFVDFAPPAGEFDISDVVAFLSLFGQGCP